MSKKVTNLTRPPPAEVEHHLFVVRIIQRDTGKWFSTVSKDATRIYEASDVDTKEQAIKLAADVLTGLATGLYSGS